MKGPFSKLIKHLNVNFQKCLIIEKENERKDVKRKLKAWNFCNWQRQKRLKL
jgi:hypothetical protein